MGELVWDQAGSRIFEAGVDRGVLYPPGEYGVAWNGLVSIDEKRSSGSTTPYYVDGVKYYETTTLTDYLATLNAYTYPDEFSIFDGVATGLNGMYLDNQVPKTFGLSYRTRVGNDLEGSEFGYKIHCLYNLTAIPTDKSYNTIGEDAEALEFSWTISGTPEKTPGYRPTAHFVFDTTKQDPRITELLETILYGGEGFDAALPSLADMITLFNEWAIIRVVDNEDGTWYASSDYNRILMLDSTTFQITDVDGYWIDEVTYQINNTTMEPVGEDINADVVYDGGRPEGEVGTWTASGEDTQITMLNATTFQITNVEGVFLDSVTYQIDSTNLELTVIEDDGDIILDGGTP